MREFAENQDAITATEIANSIGVHPHEISMDDMMSSKFKDVVDFLSPFGDRGFIAASITRGIPKEQAIDHLWRYVDLRKQHETKRGELDQLTSELSRFEHG